MGEPRRFQLLEDTYTTTQLPHNEHLAQQHSLLFPGLLCS